MAKAARRYFRKLRIRESVLTAQTPTKVGQGKVSGSGMAMDMPEQPKTSDWIDYFKRMSEIAVVLIAALYVAGFVVTSTYMGRFGVVHLDAIRIRFIVTGAVFIVFCVIVLTPCFLLAGLVFDTHHKPDVNQPVKVVTNALAIVLPFVMLLFLVIGGLLFIASRTLYIEPGNVPGIASLQAPSEGSIDWSAKLVRYLFFPLVLAAIMAINNGQNFEFREGSQVHSSARRQILVKGALAGLLLGIVMSGAPDLYQFLTSGTFGTRNSLELRDFSVPFPILKSAPWTYFVTSIYVFVSMGATFVLVALMLRGAWPRTVRRWRYAVELGAGGMHKRNLLWLSLLLIVPLGISALLHTYAEYVYPVIPQQFGGGRPIRVAVALHAEDTKTSYRLAESAGDIYLLDRSPSSSFFLVARRVTPTATISSVVEAVETFAPTPQPVTAITALNTLIISGTASLSDTATAVNTSISSATPTATGTATPFPLPSPFYVIELSNEEIESLLYLPER